LKKSAMMIPGLLLLLYIAPLGLRPIIIPDESRYAEIPREMIASGDWIVPHLNGLRYFEKPVLGYWINAASMLLFGENAFAIRLPSALAAGLSSLILFFMVRRFVGRDSIGILASAVFLTCLEVVGVGTFSVLDTMLALFTTGMMATFFFAHMEEMPGKRRAFLALSGIFCGLAFLTKGFIAVVMPLAAIVPFMVWERRWSDLFQTCWIPIVAAVLVSLPWAVMIHIREPDFWHFFFWNEHIRRFMAGNAQHMESFWYFLRLLPGAVLPWTFLIPAAVFGLKSFGSENKLIRFAICWFIFPFLFFSVSNGKLLTYILPCFPPVAILMAVGLHNYLKEGKKKAFTAGALSLGAVLTVLAVTLIVLQVWGFHDLKPYSKTWQWVLAVTGLLSWMVLLLASRASHWSQKVMYFAAAPVLLMITAPLLLPDGVAEHKAPGEFLLRHAHRIRPAGLVVSDEDPLGAVCWFYKRSDVYLLGGAGELDYGLGYNDLKHRMLNLARFRALISKNHGSGTATLIARAKNYQDWKQDLPEPCFEDTSGDNGFVFAQY